MKKFENRYANKEYQKKSNSLVLTLLSVGRIVLMIAGLVGIAYNLVREKGWLSTGFTELTKSMTTFLIGGAVLIAIFFFADKLLSSKTKDGTASSKGDIALYAMMAAGAYFIFKFVTD